MILTYALLKMTSQRTMTGHDRSLVSLDLIIEPHYLLSSDILKVTLINDPFFLISAKLLELSFPMKQCLSLFLSCSMACYFDPCIVY